MSDLGRPDERRGGAAGEAEAPGVDTGAGRGAYPGGAPFGGAPGDQGLTATPDGPDGPGDQSVLGASFTRPYENRYALDYGQQYTQSYSEAYTQPRAPPGAPGAFEAHGGYTTGGAAGAARGPSDAEAADLGGLWSGGHGGGQGGGREGGQDGEQEDGRDGGSAQGPLLPPSSPDPANPSELIGPDGQPFNPLAAWHTARALQKKLDAAMEKNAALLRHNARLIVLLKARDQRIFQSDALIQRLRAQIIRMVESGPANQ